MEEFSFIINGQSVAAKSFFDVHDPATGELVGKCPIAEKSDLDLSLIHISEPTRPY